MKPIPRDLKIVAYLFIISGVLATIDTLITLFDHQFAFNLEVFSILIAKGLFDINPRSRIWALVLTLLGLIATPVWFVLDPTKVSCLALDFGPVSPVLGFAINLAAFALFCWQFRVLTAPHIHQLFNLKKTRGRTVIFNDAGNLTT